MKKSQRQLILLTLLMLSLLLIGSTVSASTTFGFDEYANYQAGPNLGIPGVHVTSGYIIDSIFPTLGGKVLRSDASKPLRVMFDTPQSNVGFKFATCGQPLLLTVFYAEQPEQSLTFVGGFPAGPSSYPVGYVQLPPPIWGFEAGVDCVAIDELTINTFVPQTTNTQQAAASGALRFESAGAIYVDSSGISVYQVSNGSRGQLVASVSAVQALGIGTPSRNTLLAASGDGFYAIYKLTSGEFQINMGPDTGSKVYVTIFSGIPAQGVRYADYIGGPHTAPGARTGTTTVRPTTTTTTTTTVTVPIVPGPGGTYTVQRGDSLYRIAKRLGVALDALIALNGIQNPGLIYAGQVLQLP